MLCTISHHLENTSAHKAFCAVRQKQKSEIRSQKSEVRSQKLEIRNPEKRDKEVSLDHSHSTTSYDMAGMAGRIYPP